MYYSNIQTKWGSLLVAANDSGITHIDLQTINPTTRTAKNWQRDNKPVIQEAIEQLTAYFAGKLRKFELPLAPIGTEFQQKVWNALQNVKYGQTASYKDIATKIGQPKACRAVGSANAKNPIQIVIPCHRIIGANGKLTGYAKGLQMKQELLVLENRN